MPKTRERVADVAGTAKPYVERALHDEELREHVRQAFGAAREVYDELIGRRGMAGVASRVAADHEIHDNLRTAIAELRQAAARLQGQREAKRAGRKLVFLVSAGAVLLFNPITGPQTRRWLKEKLVGGDEFGFSDDGQSSGNGTS